MNWADRAYHTCVRDDPLAPEAELDRLAYWIFAEELLDGEITKELRRQTYGGLAVTVCKELDLRLNITATNNDNDYDRWSTTVTVDVRATREMATQTEMEEVPLNPAFHFHLLDLLLSGQLKMRWAKVHLIRGQEVIMVDQQSQSRARVTCSRCGQDGHYSRGCAK